MGLAALVLGTLLVPGCGDGAAGAPDERAVFTPCEGDYECATVEVPVDYAEPNGAKIGIAILRAPARDPAARLGAVVVNPGGPGVAFVDRLATTYPVLSAAFADATARFDVVTFDWRGVGRSAPIGCGDDALLEKVRAVDLTLASTGSFQAVAELRQALVSGCLSKVDPKLLGAMNTENAARDLDRIRAALGEEKLNYLGFSYGSWLGATYATLFPERVRALALDAATVVMKDFESDITEQARSYELGLSRFFEACARDARCKLRGAGTSAADPAAVAARFDQVAAKAKGEPGIAAGARRLSLVDLRFALSDALRNADWLDLAADLASADAGDGAALIARADLVTGRRADGTYDTSILGLLAIACLDQTFTTPSLEAFQTFAQSALTTSPRGAPSALLPWALCTDWPYRRAGARLAIAASAAPRALVVSGRYDPITSYEQGPELVRLLGNGSSLLTYEGDGHVSALRSACVRAEITSFLIDPARPPSKASCAAE